ncbi:hypothetical protein, variant [Verruconis gallopava]|nr:hypothetical protein, variant [Verruconis gallopava]KIW04024.1 hypothetical protein, variant [Verruconis gallopava]
MYQALFINTAALWVIFTDPERRIQNEPSNWAGRLWGYNGAIGMCQAFAAGYFLWDVLASTIHLDVMGMSSLVHAIAALGVTSIGFRPFANYYGLNFVLYELSTPFLNIHWFLDKANMTGSTAQLINGILLLASFGGSRLVWGTYQSWMIYKDIWHAWNNPRPSTAECLKYALYQRRGAGLEIPLTCRELPNWLALLYVGANTALTVLNFYWYSLMIAAVRKRFVPKDEKTGAKANSRKNKQT